MAFQRIKNKWQLRIDTLRKKISFLEEDIEQFEHSLKKATARFDKYTALYEKSSTNKSFYGPMLLKTGRLIIRIHNHIDFLEQEKNRSEKLILFCLNKKRNLRW